MLGSTQQCPQPGNSPRFNPPHPFPPHFALVVTRGVFGMGAAAAAASAAAAAAAAAAGLKGEGMRRF